MLWTVRTLRDLFGLAFGNRERTHARLTSERLASELKRKKSPSREPQCSDKKVE